MRRAGAVVAVAALVCGLAAAVTAAPADAAAGRARPTSGGFAAVPASTGVALSLAPWRTATLRVTGRNQVPRRVAAVTVLVTVLAPRGNGRLTAWGAGRAPGGTSLQFAAGRSVTDTVVAAPDSRGRIHVVARLVPGAPVRVRLAVTGYYRRGAALGPGAYRPVTQRTVLDTRAGQAVAAGGTRTVAVGGRAGVPGSGVGAVAVTITSAHARADGALTAYATGLERPSQVTQYLRAGPAQSNFALVPVDAQGRFDVHNGSAAPVQLIVDVVGYVRFGAPLGAGRYKTSVQTRLAATRAAAGAVVRVPVRGRGGVPLAAGGSVLVSVSATSPAAAGSATVWPSGARPPSTPVVRWEAGANAMTQTLVRIGADGRVALRNDSRAPVTLILDLHGYTAPTSIGARTPQLARYFETLVDRTSRPDYLDVNAALVRRMGCNDARAGYRFVLLDLGAQTITAPLSREFPGIALALNTNGLDGGPARLTYADLVTVFDAYLAAAGSAACNPKHRPMSIAIGTSNDGTWDVYGAVDRGRDYATRFIARLHPPRGIRVLAANDIEPDFGTGRAADALAWEDAYLAADRGAHTLVFNGAASGCPDTFGDTTGTCNNGWTQAQLYRMAHRDDGSIVALPQIYSADMARQWTNIDAAGGGRITFLGALSEQVRAPAELGAVQGYAYLYRALSSVRRSPAVGYAVAFTSAGG